jgi:hypothetical protein
MINTSLVKNQNRFISLSVLIFFGWMSMIIIAPLTHSLLLSDHSPFFGYMAAIIQAKKALLEGQFPLRDTFLNSSGLRFPYFQFYSPSTYTIAAILFNYVATDNPLITLKLMIWLATAVGGYYFYRLSYLLVRSRYIALITACIYLFSPYHIIIIDQLNAFNTAIGFGILPILLFYTFRLSTESATLKYFIAVTIFAYLLITVHLITFFYSAFFILGFAMYLTISQRNIKQILTIISAYLIAGCLAMWYLAPLVMVSQHIFIPALNHSTSTNNLSFLNLIAMTAHFLPGLNYHQASQILPSIGAPIVGGLAIAIYLIGYRQLDTSINQKRLIGLASICTLLIIIMCSPTNKIMLNPWYLLGQLSWIGALVAGYVLQNFVKKPLHFIQFIFAVLLIIASSSTWLSPASKVVASVPSFLKNPEADFEIKAYLPPTPLLPARQMTTNPSLKPNQILSLATTLKHCHGQKNTVVCTFIPDSNIQSIELPTLYYPSLMQITLNTQDVAYNRFIQNNQWMTSIKPLPNTTNTITITFRGLAWANRLSFCTWMMLFIVIGFSAARRIGKK